MFKIIFRTKVFLLLASTLLSFSLLEVITYFITKKNNDQSVKQIPSEKLAPHMCKRIDDAINKFYNGASASMHISHPYYGFLNLFSEKYHDDINLFPIDSLYYEYRLKLMSNEKKRLHDKVYIGILGGSVADSFFHYNDKTHYLASLLKNKPAFRNKKIKIINLTQISGKQPQQFEISSRFQKLLDITINIDGFNEMKQINHFPHYPLEFPPFYKFLYHHNEENLSLMSKIFICHKIKNILANLRRNSFLGKTNSYGFLYQVLTSKIDTKIAALLKKRLTPPPENNLYTLPEWNEKRVLKMLSYIWKDFATMQYKLSRANGVAAFFFLQPNQHVESAKKFNDNQRAIAFGEIKKPNTAIMNEYKLLQSRIAEMKDIPIWDLTNIYKNMSNDIFIDDCCHVNDFGNRIMTEAIALHVSKITR